VAIEKWISVASLGLFIMFVGQMISISIYLTHPSQDIDPSSQIKEFVSISIAPAIILSGSAYVMGRRYGSRFAGSLIMSGGLITIIGMYYVTILIKQIQDVYLVPELTVGPFIFMATSIPVVILGLLLFKLKPMPKRDYFFDR
jgi:hypothetical protein